jgi:MFS superfamily sulfate permease-like transporter
MNSIVTAVLISVISTVIVSLLTACVVFFKKQAKTYQGLLERERKDNLRNTVREELEPVIEEINRLQARVEKCEAKEQEDVKIILHSYKFRLIQLCQTYLRQ